MIRRTSASSSVGMSGSRSTSRSTGRGGTGATGYLLPGLLGAPGTYQPFTDALRVETKHVVVYAGFPPDCSNLESLVRWHCAHLPRHCSTIFAHSINARTALEMQRVCPELDVVLLYPFVLDVHKFFGNDYVWLRNLTIWLILKRMFLIFMWLLVGLLMNAPVTLTRLINPSGHEAHKHMQSDCPRWELPLISALFAADQMPLQLPLAPLARRDEGSGASGSVLVLVSNNDQVAFHTAKWLAEIYIPSDHVRVIITDCAHEFELRPQDVTAVVGHVGRFMRL